jgi:UDP-N-acetylmuramate--alanine ligase
LKNWHNDLEKHKKYFLVGIGGAGMSAIAVVLKGLGFEVSGSDIKESRYTNVLRNENIKVYIGHSRENIKDADAVVYSTAIPQDNVEIAASKEKNIAVYSRSDILAWILNSNIGIAVAGTHGKTTTTSMISLIMRSLNLDPTIIIGGELNELGSNARFGNGDYVIAEACESDGSFLKYKPFVSVVNNIEEDHLDYYKSYENLKKSFVEFIKNTKPGGLIVLNGDEVKLPPGFTKPSNVRIIRYGLDSKNDVCAENVKFSNFTSSYTLIVKENKKFKKIKVKLNVPGTHNVKNSLAALAVCCGIGLDVSEAARVLRLFTGVKRRFEKRGERNGAMMFDDYAHHPSEVKVTLQAAFTEKKERIISVFQPHRYTRLKSLHNKFGGCFDLSDILIITDVYGSGEQPIPGVTGKLLLDSLIADGYGKEIAYIPKLQDVSEYLQQNMRKDDMVLVMGAGDVTRITEELLKT